MGLGLVGDIGSFASDIGSSIGLGGASSAASAASSGTPWGAIGAGASLLGGLLTNKANADIASSNNDWSAAQYAKRYQTMTADLKAAGLNPMLAYSQSPGSAPTAQQVQFQNPVSAATQGYSQVASGAQSYSSANQAESFAKQADAATAKIVEETKNVSDQGLVLRMTAQQLTASATLMAQQGATQQQQQAVLVQTVKNLEKDGVLKQLDIDAAKSLANFGRTSKELAPAVNVLLQLLRK